MTGLLTSREVKGVLKQPYKYHHLQLVLTVSLLLISTATYFFKDIWQKLQVMGYMHAKIVSGGRPTLVVSSFYLEVVVTQIC